METGGLVGFEATLGSNRLLAEADWGGYVTLPNFVLSEYNSTKRTMSKANKRLFQAYKS